LTTWGGYSCRIAHKLTSVTRIRVFKSTSSITVAPLTQQIFAAMVYFVLLGVTLFFGLFYSAAAYFHSHLASGKAVKA